MRSQKCFKTFDCAKEFGGNRQVWQVTVKNRFRITKNGRFWSALTQCVWDDKTLLIYCFSLTFNFLTTLGIRIVVSTWKKKTVRHASRPRVSERGSWRPIFVMNELSSIYTQASIHCLRFTTATSIIFVLSAKVTTPQRPLKPPKSTDIWSVMHILSLSL